MEKRHDDRYEMRRNQQKRREPKTAGESEECGPHEPGEEPGRSDLCCPERKRERARDPLSNVAA